MTRYYIESLHTDLQEWRTEPGSEEGYTSRFDALEELGLIRRVQAQPGSLIARAQFRIVERE